MWYAIMAVGVVKPIEISNANLIVVSQVGSSEWSWKYFKKTVLAKISKKKALQKKVERD